MRKLMIDYTNWRGERRLREIEPISMRFGSNEWHKEEQWLILAKTSEGDREFALKDMEVISVCD